MSRKAGLAIDGAIAAWFKRDGRCHATFRAHGIEGRTGSRIASIAATAGLPFAGNATVFTALRFVGKAFIGVELLFAGRKRKIRPTVFTGKCLVFQVPGPPRLG